MYILHISIIHCMYLNSLQRISYTKGSELCLFLKIFFIILPLFIYLYFVLISIQRQKKKLRLWLMIHLIESRPVSVIFHKIICINDVNVFDCGNFLYISGKYNMFSSKLSTLSNFNKNKLFCTSQFCFWIQPLYNELTMEREFVN